MSYKTVTGIPLEEIPAKLQETFKDKKAYKDVPGGANLTDINTGFMLERVTEVFGLKGFGWNLKYKPEDMELSNLESNRVTARLRYAEFSYVLVADDGSMHEFVVPTGGANQNTLSYVEEGARTSALGAALKGMTFQLPIYKNIFDHHNPTGETRPTNSGNQRETRQGKPSGTRQQATASAPAPQAATPAPQAATPAPHGDALATALKATIPVGIPLAGQTLEQATKGGLLGKQVLMFLSGEKPNSSKQYFKPTNVEQESLVEHAKVALEFFRSQETSG